MALLASVGQASLLKADQAGAQATAQALAGVEHTSVRLGFVITPVALPGQEIISGINSELGGVPLFGFSTTGTPTQHGIDPYTVTVGLLAGDDLLARAGWWPGTQERPDSYNLQLAAHKMLETLQPDLLTGTLLLAVDGLAGDAGQAIALPARRWSTKVTGALANHASQNRITGPEGRTIAGCLAGGIPHHGRTYQIGGGQGGEAGLAAAWLSGECFVGVGTGHGWHTAGAYFRVTRSSGLYIQTLDDLPATEVYARVFGFTSQEWCSPPLNELVRMYPLGVEPELDDAQDRAASPLVIRTPQRVEADGSLRMNTRVPEGSMVHLMLSNPDDCLEASRKAARQALSKLKSAQGAPKASLALVLVDDSWRILFEAQPGEELKAVRAVVGKSVPVMCGYTLGQIAPSPTSYLPELLNQHIEVLLFGA